MRTMLILLHGVYHTMHQARARIALPEEALCNKGNHPPMELKQTSLVLPQEMLRPVPPTSAEVIKVPALGQLDRFASAPPHPLTYTHK